MNRREESRCREAEKRGRGRPRAFDRATAVEHAMRLFWERGYEGASYDALTRSMGMSASSLRNAFGSKEALFREAVQHYGRAVSTWFAEGLAGPGTTREVFDSLLADAATAFTRSDFPTGCMISITSTQTAPDQASIRTFATQARQGSQRALADRIRRGIAEGDVPARTDADALGAYFAAVLRGMAVQARDGASRAELLTIGALAARTWPSDRPSNEA